MTDKRHCQKGNSPDSCLRSPSYNSVEKDVRLLRQPGCWLRSSHSFKECVIAHWSSDLAPKIQRGLSYTPKTEVVLYTAVAERSLCCWSQIVKSGGGTGSANVGMSNVMKMKTLHTECPRFPLQRQSKEGESVLRNSRKALSDGYQVNIPELFMKGYYLCGDAS